VADVEKFDVRKLGDAIDTLLRRWKALWRLLLTPVLPAFILTDNSGSECGCYLVFMLVVEKFRG